MRGTIIDADNKIPLIGAEIIWLGTNPIIGTTTDENGKFRFDQVALGRAAF